MHLEGPTQSGLSRFLEDGGVEAGTLQTQCIHSVVEISFLPFMTWRPTFLDAVAEAIGTPAQRGAKATATPGRNHYLLDAFPHLDLTIIIPSSKDLHMSVDSKNYLVLPLMFYKLGFFILCGYMCSPAVRNYSIHVQFLPTPSPGLLASPVCVVRAMLIWDTPQKYSFWCQLHNTESL